MIILSSTLFDVMLPQEKSILPKYHAMDFEAEKQLVESAKTDSESFGKLYDHYFQKVYYFVAAKVSNPHDAEDITSDIFMKILENLHKFEWRGLPFGAWVFRIARNALHDFYNKSNKNQTTDIDQVYDLSESEEKASPKLKAAKDELAKKINNILKTLSEKELTVIQLKFFAELSNREITHVTGLSESNVAIIIFRTLRKIKPDLETFHNYF